MLYTQNNIGWDYNTVNLGTFSVLTSTEKTNTSEKLDTSGVDSIMVVNSISSALTSGKKLNHKIEYEFSEDGTNWDTPIVYLADSQIATGKANAPSQFFTYKMLFNTMGSKRYIRFKVTNKADNASGDTILNNIVAVCNDKNK